MSSKARWGGPECSRSFSVCWKAGITSPAGAVSAKYKSAELILFNTSWFASSILLFASTLESLFPEDDDDEEADEEELRNTK